MEDEPPDPGRNGFRAEKNGVDVDFLKKILLMEVNGSKYAKPRGFESVDFEELLGLTNPAVILEGEDLTMYLRAIYRDSKGFNSAILEYKGRQNGLIEIEPEGRPLFLPQEPHGLRGVEDFRIARVNGEKPYHGFLVHFNGFDARTEYVRTLEDSVNEWDRFGIYFPNIELKEATELVKGDEYKKWWNFAHRKHLGTKDCSLWPRKVLREDKDGEIKDFYGVIIRFLPDIQIVYCRDFQDLAREEFWRDAVSSLDDYTLLKKKYWWEDSHIGLAGQPLEIDEGTLVFYHGAKMNPRREYRFGAALIDKENPHKIIARTKEPLMEVSEEWERGDEVVSGDVLFPTHHIDLGDRIGHFYGAADTRTGYAVTSKKGILNKMETV